MATINLTGTKNLDDLDRPRYHVAGWYRGTIVQHSISEKSEEVLTIRTNGGPYDNLQIDFKMGSPDMVTGDTAQQIQDRAAAASNRLAQIAKRFDLITAADIGKTIHLDFGKLIGREIIFEIQTRKGDRGSFSDIAYTGIYPPNFARIPPEVRKQLGVGQAGHHSSQPAAPGKPAFDPTTL